MLEEDYRAISEIIEEVVGEDTVMGVRLLEGLKYYFEKKSSSRIKVDTILKASQEAMDRLSEKTLRESQKYRELRKTFIKIEEEING